MYTTFTSTKTKNSIYFKKSWEKTMITIHLYKAVFIHQLHDNLDKP